MSIYLVMSEFELEPGDPYETELIEAASEEMAIEEAYNKWPSYITESGVKARLLYSSRWEQLEEGLSRVQTYLDQIREVKADNPDEHRVRSLLGHIKASASGAIDHLSQFGRFEHRPCFASRLNLCEQRATHRVTYVDHGERHSLIFCEVDATARMDLLKGLGIPFEVKPILADEIIMVS